MVSLRRPYCCLVSFDVTQLVPAKECSYSDVWLPFAPPSSSSIRGQEASSLFSLAFPTVAGIFSLFSIIVSSLRIRVFLPAQSIRQSRLLHLRQLLSAWEQSTRNAPALRFEVKQSPTFATVCDARYHYGA
jgi:hypothetical protein